MKYINTKLFIIYFFFFLELNEKLKLMEEKNSLLSKQIQEYQSKTEDNFKIVQEKQKLVSIFFSLQILNLLISNLLLGA